MQTILNTNTLPNKSQTSQELVLKLQEDIVSKENSSLLLLKADIEDINSQMIQFKLNQIKSKTNPKSSKKQTLSIPESQVPNKKEIQSDKSNNQNSNTPNIELQETQDQAQITKGKDLSELFSCFQKECLERLWLPTETDLQDFSSNSSSSYLNQMDQFSKNTTIRVNPIINNSSQMIQFPQSLISQTNIMDQEDIITRKIRIYPNELQRSYFNKCFGANRYFFNKSNELCKQDTLINGKCKLSMIDIRKQIIEDKKDQFKDVSYDTKQLAIKQLIASYKQGQTNQKKNKNYKFDVQYKKRSCQNQIFHIDHRAFNIESNEISIFPQYFKKLSKETKRENLQTLRIRNRSQKLLAKINKQKIKQCDSLIQKQGFKYYFILVVKIKKVEPSKPVYTDISLDPGMRSFQSFYSSQGVCGSFGNNLKQVFDIYFEQLDSLDKQKNKTKEQRRMCQILRNKCTNIMNDIHNKTCLYISQNYENVLIPIFKSKQIVQKSNNKCLNRVLMQQKHFSFRTKLEYFCKKYQRNFFVVDESYTSRICGKCLNVKQGVFEDKVYNCSKCEIILDRDLNASRNILIKNLKERV